MVFRGTRFDPHIEFLAKDLKTTTQKVLQYAEGYNETDERIKNNIVPQNVENYIRLQHLKDTHPDVYKFLCEVRPIDNSYDRWIGELHYELRKLKKRGE